MNTLQPAPPTAAPKLNIVALAAVIGTLAGCAESITPLADGGHPDSAQQLDAGTIDSGRLVDASVCADTGGPDAPMDAGVMPDAQVADVPEDAGYIRYERDVRPLLEASACGDCHAGIEVVMDYAWISAPGETWCAGDLGYERRWDCFEEHARTQTMEAPGAQGCGSDFYHRHGEPCFQVEARTRVLDWAADGYRE